GGKILVKLKIRAQFMIKSCLKKLQGRCLGVYQIIPEAIIFPKSENDISHIFKLPVASNFVKTVIDKILDHIDKRDKDLKEVFNTFSIRGSPELVSLITSNITVDYFKC
ncbi:TPA: hypothetical protein ACSHSZ_002617, partial [Legionella pneumophila]